MVTGAQIIGNYMCVRFDWFREKQTQFFRYTYFRIVELFSTVLEHGGFVFFCALGEQLWSPNEQSGGDGSWLWMLYSKHCYCFDIWCARSNLPEAWNTPLTCLQWFELSITCTRKSLWIYFKQFFQVYSSHVPTQAVQFHKSIHAKSHPWLRRHLMVLN